MSIIVYIRCYRPLLIVASKKYTPFAAIPSRTLWSSASSSNKPHRRSSHSVINNKTVLRTAPDGLEINFNLTGVLSLSPSNKIVDPGPFSFPCRTEIPLVHSLKVIHRLVIHTQNKGGTSYRRRGYFMQETVFLGGT